MTWTLLLRPSRCPPFATRFTVLSTCCVDTIPYVPVNGYAPRNNQSHVALKWLLWLNEKPEWNHQIQHVRNGGEYVARDARVGPVDGYHAPTRTCFEFKGCYWHCCKSCYRDTDLGTRGWIVPWKKFIGSPLSRKKSWGGKIIVWWWRGNVSGAGRKRRIPRCGVTITIWWSPWISEKHFMADERDVPGCGHAWCPGVCIAWIIWISVSVPLLQHQSSTRRNHYPPWRRREWAAHRRPVRAFGELGRRRSRSISRGSSCISPLHRNDRRGTSVGYQWHLRVHQVWRGSTLPWVVPSRVAVSMSEQVHVSVVPFVCRIAGARALYACPWRALLAWHVGQRRSKKLALRKGYRIRRVWETYHYPQRSRQLFRSNVLKFQQAKEHASGWPTHVTTPEQRAAYVQDYEAHEGVSVDPDRMHFNPGVRAIAKHELNSLWANSGNRPTKCRPSTSPKCRHGSAWRPHHVTTFMPFIPWTKTWSLSCTTCTKSIQTAWPTTCAPPCLLRRGRRGWLAGNCTWKCWMCWRNVSATWTRTRAFSRRARGTIRRSRWLAPTLAIWRMKFQASTVPMLPWWNWHPRDQRSTTFGWQRAPPKSNSAVFPWRCACEKRWIGTACWWPLRTRWKMWAQGYHLRKRPTSMPWPWSTRTAPPLGACPQAHCVEGHDQDVQSSDWQTHDGGVVAGAWLRRGSMARVWNVAVWHLQRWTLRV